MAKKTVGLHSEVTANASQFVQEYNRADNVSRRHSASIRAEFEKTEKVLMKGWSLPRFAKQFTKGIGIGSAFGVLDKGFDLIVDLWNKPKEDAKEFAEYLQKSLETARELKETRLAAFADSNPGQAGTPVNIRINTLEQQLADAEKRKAEAIGWLGVLGERMMPQDLAKRSGMSISVADKIASEQMEAAQKDIDRLAPAIDKWKKTLAEIGAKKIPEAAEKALKEFFGPMDEFAKSFSDRIGQLRSSFIERIQTPIEKFNEELGKIVELRRLNLITEDQAKRGVFTAQQAMNKASEPNMSRWDKALGRVQVDEMTKRGMSGGENYGEIQRTNQSIMAEIRDILKAAIQNGFVPGYGE